MNNSMAEKHNLNKKYLCKTVREIMSMPSPKRNLIADQAQVVNDHEAETTEGRMLIIRNLKKYIHEESRAENDLPQIDDTSSKNAGSISNINDQKIFEKYTQFHPATAIKEIIEDPETLDTHYRQEPVFLYDIGRLRANVNMFIKSGFPGTVAYAVKANPEILDILSNCGISTFDVASLGEIKLVLEAQPQSRLLYNNPIKTPYEVEIAAKYFGTRHFTIQSWQGVEDILQNTRGINQAELEIVVRIKVQKNESALVDFSEKFGVEIPEAEKMILYLKEKTSVKVGLSTHTGSQNPSVESYHSAISQIVAAAKNFDYPIDILNIGGGFPANYYGYPPVDVKEMLEKINQILERERAGNYFREILMEPGRAIVAEAATMMIPIAEAKGNIVRIRDGVYGSFNSIKLHGFLPIVKAYHRNENAWEEIMTNPAEHIVFGCTCDSDDKIKMLIPAGIQSGDLLEFPSVGAYTVSSRSKFNGFTESPRTVYFNAQETSAQNDKKPVIGGAHTQELTSACSLNIDHFKSIEITPEVIRKTAYLYKEIFDNRGHYLYNPKTGVFYSPAQIFGEKRYFDIHELIDLSKNKMIDPITGDQLIFYHHPEVLLQRLTEKMTKNVYLTFVGDVGFTFANDTTVEEAWIAEGWSDPLYFSELAGTVRLRDKETFYRLINKAIMDNYSKLKLPKNACLQPDSRIMTWNAIGIKESERGKGYAKLLISSFLKKLPAEIIENRLDVVEAVGDIGKSKNAVAVNGIFQNENDDNKKAHVLMIDRFLNYIET
ncbi:MAG: hypothetical protein NTZ80_00685 [Patescibacteria group bacterium]|nr:hypothetical protein [Patescibacteria group bacterium]